MKSTFLLTVISIFLLVGNQVFAQNIYVPDDNFEQALIDLRYDSGELNDSVLTANINSLTYLDIGQKNISDLAGIEDFRSLINLNCTSNNLSNLTVDSIKNLEIISCGGNNLTNLALNSNTDLKYLYCGFNQLSSLDVSNNPLLIRLLCDNNLLTSLDISQNGVLN